MSASHVFPFPPKESTLDISKGRFSGRVAIVTGGASGIGRATVDRLVNDGGSVAIFDINETLGQQVETELTGKGGTVSFYNVDVTKMAAVEDGVKKVVDKYGGVHLLVNNAVNFDSAGATDVTHDNWVGSLSVNIEGVANMVKVCYRFMRKDDRCSIVNLGSVGAYAALPMRMTYCCTKAAIAQMTRNMALDLIDKQVRVNCVEPGATYTPEVAKAFGSREKADEYYKNCHITGRAGNPAEVASAICFLLSDDASFMTATCVPVDGGYLAMRGERFGDTSTIAATKE